MSSSRLPGRYRLGGCRGHRGAAVKRSWMLVLMGLELGLSTGTSRGPGGEATDDHAQAQDGSDGASKDAFHYNRLIGRGVNLGNALEAAEEGQWGLTLRAAYFRIIREAGFDSVRIPVRWSARAGKGFPYAIDESFFERVDWAISQALDNGLVVIVDVHHYDALMKDPGSHKERFLALWRQ